MPPQRAGDSGSSRKWPNPKECLDGGDGKRFVVHADEKLTAFVELECAIRAGSG
jgi:hypothetical protein